MLSEIAERYIRYAIDAELDVTKAEREVEFNSMHEAESVINEEYEETTEYLKSVKRLLDGMHLSLRADDRESWEEKEKSCEKAAAFLIGEAVQLAAMLRKGIKR